MSNNFFSPNQKVTGGAGFFSYNELDGCVYLKLLKQIANNANKKENFDGKNPITLKLGQDEAADIIRAVRVNGESKFFHQFNETTTSGSFKYYEIPNSTPLKNGFGLSVRRKGADNQEKEIKVGFTPASAERLSLFLAKALNDIFQQEHWADVEQAKQYKAKSEKAETTLTVQQANSDF